METNPEEPKKDLTTAADIIVAAIAILLGLCAGLVIAKIVMLIAHVLNS